MTSDQSENNRYAGRDESREISALFDDSSFFANVSAAENANRAHHSANSSNLNVSALCCDEEFSGFDRLSGRTWIYPTNYPVRDYQFNIIKATILQNTLVSLPTGLGKTFIAAVIMYNFYRWYPLGKIVFTAPTRPLVAQQINACYDVVAIPRADTIEMTGHMQVTTRKTHWKEKRVFFATPQVIYNDLKSGICPADKIRCLVFDEAHRARGNYAYCQIVSTLTEMGHTTYRVLALSATPGSKVDDVISVVQNLHISHLELRTENCIDVQRYSHTKKINTVVVPLGEQLNQLKQQYVEILDTYTRRLKQLNILTGNIENLSKGRIIMLYKEFQSRDRGARHPQHNNIMRDFTILISLYHGLELLSRHGSRVFLNFFDEHTEKGWMQADDRLTVMLERLRDDLGVNPMALDRSTLPDGSVPPIPKNLTFGHPKFEHLRTIMMRHFNEAKEQGRETKAIVFCEYRESVHLVHCLLLQCRPLIQPQMFVGQGAAGKDKAVVVSQKAQLRTMRQFRSGACNTLVSTCVGEEGLDVGSVDLIICFDISTKSPVRLVQRCGRTGRERRGQVFILVTEGREHQTLQEGMRQRDHLTGRILGSAEVQRALYGLNPRMLPQDLTPECRKMHITVDRTHTAEKEKKTGQKDLRSMLTERTPSDQSLGASGLITGPEYQALCSTGLPREDYFDTQRELWACSKEVINSHTSLTRPSLDLSAWLDWQRRPQTTAHVAHSTDTDILSHLLTYADTKRFQMTPSTQQPDFNTQMFQAKTQALNIPQPSEQKKKLAGNKQKLKVTTDNTKTNNFGDIRALFSTTKKSTKEYTKAVKDLGIDNTADLPTSLVDLLVDLCLQDETKKMGCHLCKIINCDFLQRMKKNYIYKPITILKNINLPDINLLNTLDIESIEKAGHQNNQTQCSSEDIFEEDIITDNAIFSKHKKSLAQTPSQNSEQVNTVSNFDLKFDFDFDVSDFEERKSHDNESASNFNIGGLEDIFEDSDCSNNENSGRKIEKNPKQTLQFFGLDSLDDIFADSNSDVEVIENSPTDPKKQDPSFDKSPTYTEDSVPKPLPERPSSPSLLLGTEVVNNTIIYSPILCSQRNKSNLSKISPTSPILCSQIRNVSGIINSCAKASTPMASLNYNNAVINIEENSMDWSEFQDELPQETNEKTNMDCAGSKSLFTVTQIIDIINDPTQSKESTTKNCAVASTFKTCIGFTSSQTKPTYSTGNVDRNISPIIFTQNPKIKHDNNKIYNSSASAKNNKPQSSPIILTQTDSYRTTHHKSETKQDIIGSVVVLDSNSDSTVNYSLSPDTKVDKANILSQRNSPEISRAKRKLDLSKEDESCSSPFFSKRTKLDDTIQQSKPSLSLKDKIRSLFPDRNNQGNSQTFTAVTNNIRFQKENRSPGRAGDNANKSLHRKKNNKKSLSHEDLHIDFKDSLKSQNPIEKLQAFRRSFQNENRNSGLSGQNKFQEKKSTHCSSDSDDDFVTNTSIHEKNHKIVCPVVNYKVRKKKAFDFLDLSAELSGSHDSGDELTDESAGSVAEFICDDTHHDGEDMQAHYLRSIKSPVNGKFKIPSLPSRFTAFENDEDYEMDSFCVEANMGLTQVHEVSALELAERKLNRKKRRRHVTRRILDETDSPVGRPRQTVRRLISSGSDSD